MHGQFHIPIIGPETRRLGDTSAWDAEEFGKVKEKEKRKRKKERRRKEKINIEYFKTL